MKKFRAYLKVEPTIETEKDYPTDDELHSILMDISMDINDFIGFEEVEEEFKKEGGN